MVIHLVCEMSIHIFCPFFFKTRQPLNNWHHILRVFCSFNPGLRWEDYWVWSGLRIKEFDLVGEDIREKLVFHFSFLLSKSQFTGVGNTPASGILFSQLGPGPFLPISWTCHSCWRQAGGCQSFLTDTAWEVTAHLLTPTFLFHPPWTPRPSIIGMMGSCTT